MTSNGIILRIFAEIGSSGGKLRNSEVGQHCLQPECSPNNPVFGNMTRGDILTGHRDKTSKTGAPHSTAKISDQDCAAAMSAIHMSSCLSLYYFI